MVSLCPGPVLATTQALGNCWPKSKNLKVCILVFECLIHLELFFVYDMDILFLLVGFFFGSPV